MKPGRHVLRAQEMLPGSGNRLWTLQKGRSRPGIDGKSPRKHLGQHDPYLVVDTRIKLTYISVLFILLEETHDSESDGETSHHE